MGQRELFLVEGGHPSAGGVWGPCSNSGCLGPPGGAELMFGVIVRCRRAVASLGALLRRLAALCRWGDSQGPPVSHLGARPLRAGSGACDCQPQISVPVWRGQAPQLGACNRNSFSPVLGPEVPRDCPLWLLAVTAPSLPLVSASPPLPVTLLSLLVRTPVTLDEGLALLQNDFILTDYIRNSPFSKQGHRLRLGGGRAFWGPSSPAQTLVGCSGGVFK